LSHKPNLYVLAGVNGAGKSSVGGAFLQQAGLTWYNPDTFARALMTDSGMPLEQANGLAWQEGMVHLDDALTHHHPFAFETTLGGRTVCKKLKLASATHSVRMWFCGLRTPEMHVARVQLRASRGGHDIPKEKIFARWESSRANLVDLLPFLTELSVFDNSVEALPGTPISDPKRLLHLHEGVLRYPDSAQALIDTPVWAQAIVEKALEEVAR